MHIAPGNFRKNQEIAGVVLQDFNSNIAFFLHFLLILRLRDIIIGKHQVRYCIWREKTSLHSSLLLQDLTPLMQEATRYVARSFSSLSVHCTLSYAGH